MHEIVGQQVSRDNLTSQTFGAAQKSVTLVTAPTVQHASTVEHHVLQIFFSLVYRVAACTLSAVHTMQVLFATLHTRFVEIKHRNKQGLQLFAMLDILLFQHRFKTDYLI